MFLKRETVLSRDGFLVVQRQPRKTVARLLQGGGGDLSLNLGKKGVQKQEGCYDVTRTNDDAIATHFTLMINAAPHFMLMIMRSLVLCFKRHTQAACITL